MRLGFIGLGLMGSGISANLRKAGHDLVVHDLSTNSPTLMRRLQPLFAERGAVLFDSPVSGGPSGAASGKMAIRVGGDETVFKHYRPVLDAAGDQILHIGPIGSASVA
jgi:3-hydroxyisobutyrate dehydrogenase